MPKTNQKTIGCSKKPLRKSLYNYHDYRLFLTDMIEHLKKTTYRFSLRKLACQAGFSTPNIFQQVISGQRKLHDEGIGKIASLFELNQNETEFFFNLVKMGQAETHEEKDRFYQLLAHSRRYSDLNKDTIELYDYYSHWFYPVIRELVGTADFQPDPVWIANRINPPIASVEAARALRDLEKCGHISRTDNGYVQQNPVVTTGEEVSSLAVTNFHKAMLNKAVESIDTISHSQRNISSLTFAASQERYEAIVKEIYALQQKIIVMLENDHDGTEVFQMNYQIFPCTQRPNKDKNS